MSMCQRQLPDDVLGVIRELSRPRLPFATEYRQSIRKLVCYNPRLGIFSDIRNKLYTKDAEQVIEAFVEYANAHAAAKEANHRMIYAEGSPIAEFQGYQRSVAMNRLREEEKLLALKMMLYGEKEVERIERWSMSDYFVFG